MKVMFSLLVDKLVLLLRGHVRPCIQMPSISEVDPAVTHAVKNLQSLSQERWEIYS